MNANRKVPAEAPFSPLISVVIPARNEEAHISRVVRSVLVQCPAGSVVEVIVSDDGSTDRTAEEARRAGARVVETGRDGHGGNPAVLASRFAYAFGMAAGGIRWLRRRDDAEPGGRPRPRWV